MFGVIIAGCTQWIVLLGLAEMSSALPSSGVCEAYPFIVVIAEFSWPPANSNPECTTGPIPLYLHHRSTTFQKLSGLRGRRVEHTGMVVEHSFWYHIHRYLGLFHRYTLVPRFR